MEPAPCLNEECVQNPLTERTHSEETSLRAGPCRSYGATCRLLLPSATETLHVVVCLTLFVCMTGALSPRRWTFLCDGFSKATGNELRRGLTTNPTYLKVSETSPTAHPRGALFEARLVETVTSSFCQHFFFVVVVCCRFKSLLRSSIPTVLVWM